MPEPRRLVFDDFDAAVAEAGRLLEAGYEQAGAWTLGQVPAVLAQRPGTETAGCAWRRGRYC